VIVANRRILLGGLAGGLALFVWSVTSWTLLPFEGSVFRALPSEAAIVEALRASGVQAGIYVVPAPLGPGAAGAAETEAREEKLRRGPTAVVVYDPAGSSPNRMFWPLARGVVFCLLASTFAALALFMARMQSWAARVAFVTGLGLFAWVLGPGAQWVWFNYPTDYLLVSLADALAGWLIVGIVQTGIVRR
jgi:hypothetical protein